MRYTAILLLFIGCSQFTISAQVEVDTSFSAEYYVNDILLGGGVTASNINMFGNGQQFGVISLRNKSHQHCGLGGHIDPVSFLLVVLFVSTESEEVYKSTTDQKRVTEGHRATSLFRRRCMF